MHKTKELTECCPVFDPVPWDNQIHNWTDKPFIKDWLPQFFHIPFPPMMGKVIGRMWKKAQCARKYGHNYIVAFAEA